MLVGALGVIVAEHQRRDDDQERLGNEHDLIERGGEIKGETGHFCIAVEQFGGIGGVEVLLAVEDEQCAGRQREPEERAARQASPFDGKKFEKHGKSFVTVISWWK